MRIALAFAAVIAAAAGAAPGPATRLTITVYPNGRGEPPVHRYLLRCDPASGTVSDPARACRVLRRLRNPFAPVPAGTICSYIALGPAEAFVAGRLRARPVTAHLVVRNSCEIDRWRRLAAVVPGFPAR